jgi:GAF domain-containing protein
MEASLHWDQDAQDRALEKQVRYLERRLAEEVTISELQRRLLSSAGLGEMARVLLDAVPELTACERCRFSIMLEGGKWDCWDLALGEAVHRYDLDPKESFPKEVIESGESVISPKWGGNRRHPKVELAKRVKLRSYLALPISVRNRTVGVFEAANFVHPEEIEEYNDLLGEILTPVAVGIELLRLQEQREDLVRMISHDLRGPLTVVQGQTQLLLKLLARSGQNGNLSRNAEAILTGVRRMNTMIHFALLQDSIQIKMARHVSISDKTARPLQLPCATIGPIC